MRTFFEDSGSNEEIGSRPRTLDYLPTVRHLKLRWSFTLDRIQHKYYDCTGFIMALGLAAYSIIYDMSYFHNVIILYVLYARCQPLVV
jgi:hypothetical protein